MTVRNDDRGVRTRRRPDPGDARELIERGRQRGALVTVFGRCRVEYDGRASSTLDPGDRLLVLKADGTALVHTEEGHQPINWQPPGATHDAETADGRLRIESHREDPEESLLVEYEAVEQVSVFPVDDPGDLSLEGTEADLKERILDDPGLVEAGFTPLATERETPAGAVDVYGEDDDGRPVVLELKRRRVGPDAVGQLDRYVRALDRDLHADAEIRGILVAPSVTDRGRKLLEDRGLEFVSLRPTE